MEQRDVERRERRRRINQAFREGNFERCLREIVAGLSDEPDEPHLIKALALVQNRFTDEIIRPLVKEGKHAEARRAIVTLEGHGKLGPEASAALRPLKLRIESARALQEQAPSLPVKSRVDDRSEEELDVSEKAMRKAERAWAGGRKKEAIQLLRTLNQLPLEDDDLILRRDGLRRLVEHDERETLVATERHVSAWRWVLVLVLILSAAIVATFVTGRGGFMGLNLRETPDALQERDADSDVELDTQRSRGWVLFEAPGVAGDVHDSAGLVIGSLGELISVPVGDVGVRIDANGFRDTTLSMVVTADETLVVPIELRSLPPVDGRLSFRTVPAGATVMVDGRKQTGVTPFGPLSIPPGRYRIRFEMKGRVPQVRQAEVGSGTTTVVEASLPEWHFYGRFQLNSRPWSYVFVNGDSIGPTPVTTGELATDIDHALLFRTEKGLEIRKTVQLYPGRADPTPLTVEFPKPGRLAIATTNSVTGRPVSARVFANGRLIGNSFEEFELSPGTVAIRFEKMGYSPAESTVTIFAGSRKELTLSLVPEGS
jgi:hypothetical protein